MRIGPRTVVAAMALVLSLTSGCAHLRPPQEGSAALGNDSKLKPADEYDNLIIDLWECLGDRHGRH